MTDVVPQAPTLPDLVAASASEIRRLLPDYDRFARTLITEIRRNPQLAKCEPQSFLAAAFLSAQLGLEPGPLGEVWLIPRKNKRHGGRVECTFLIGYRGLEKLALRSGRITSIEARTVYEGDDFYVEYGADPVLRHVPKHQSTTPRLWYAVARRPAPEPPLVQVLTYDQVEERRRCSSAPDSPAWKNHYDAMARKSCIRAMWQHLPLEARDVMVDRALAVDDTVPDSGALRPLDDDVIDVEPDESPELSGPDDEADE